MKQFLKEYSIYAVWGLAFSSIVGSLYYSEILGFPPCNMCWFLRIATYPLVFVVGAGIALKNKLIHLYVLPLTLIGLAVSIFHNLLYYKIIPETLAPCTAGVSCSSQFVKLFGFLDIPQQGLIGILLINIFLIIHWRLNKDV